ncbi:MULTISPECIES: MFS transporter [Salinivibrio]|uniref:MFS transporter n=2 Tax=Salinivibrio TaxID=51366 RepID=A0ABY7LHY4_9GAMM|nr:MULTISPECIES: MFS transporter [Salinivibrio]QIR05680.1 MFS transporter [Salinivibrio costicola]WBA15535.1 MFS transporter [Salinivibrio proteolyticus]
MNKTSSVSHGGCVTPSAFPWVPLVSLTGFAIASGYLMSLIPLALAPLGLAPHLAAWLASAFYAGLLLGATFSARIVATLGHRRALVMFLGIVLLSITAMAAIKGQGVWLLARFVAGVAIAGVFVVVESWLLMADSDRQRAKRLGFYMAALYGGNALGQLGVGYVGVTGNQPYWLIGGLITLAIMVPLFARHGEPRREEGHSARLGSLKSLRKAAYIGCLVSGLTLGAVYGLLPLYLAERVSDHQQVGAMMALVIVGGMAVQPVIGLVSARMSKVLLMTWLCVIGTAAVALIAFAGSQWQMGIGLVVLGAAVFAIYPVAITYACVGLAAEKIVAATEVLLLAYSVGSVSGPLLADNAFSGTNGLMTYLAVCLLSTAVYMLVMYVKERRQMPDLSAA